MLKKAMSVVLGVAVATMGLPAIATAGDTEEIHVSSVDDLKALAQRVSGGDSLEGVRVVQDADIEFTASTTGNFDPIGTKDAPFKGTYDGQGHTISGMYIYRITYGVTGGTYLGMFGYAQDATFTNMVIKNYEVCINTSYTAFEAILCPIMIGCTVSNCDIQGQVGVESSTNLSAGGICATASKCTFKNSTFTYSRGHKSNDQFGARYAAGVIANNATDGTVVSGCDVHGTLESSSGDIGGLVGALEDSSIESCTSDVAITTTGDTNGGLVGCAKDSSISNCVNNGSFSGSVSRTDGTAAGLVGTLDNSKLVNCANNGDVKSVISEDTYNHTNTSSGSIAGIVSIVKSNSEVVGCVNAGNMTIETTAVRHATARAAGVAGTVSLSDISNCYNVGTLSVKCTTTSKDYLDSNNVVGGVAIEADESSTISDCYNVGTIMSTFGSTTVNAPNLAGICALGEGTVKDCVYYRGCGCGKSGQGVVATAAQMQDTATFAAWDFNSVWRMDAADYKLPVLQWETEARTMELPAEVDLSAAKVTVAAARAYTGSAQTPAVTVTLNGAVLNAGTDYLVSYANNTNAGTASVAVEGWGKYAGNARATFSIAKAANGLSAKVSPAKLKAKALKKKAGKATVTVTGAKGKVTYKSSSKKVKVSAKGKVTVKKKTKKGSYKITVTAAGDANHAAASKVLTLKVK